jgi:hypothetical protein
MVYPCREADFGRFERVIGGEGDGEEKDAPCIWGVTLVTQRHSVNIECDEAKE